MLECPNLFQAASRHYSAYFSKLTKLTSRYHPENIVIGARYTRIVRFIGLCLLTTVSAQATRVLATCKLNKMAVV